MIKYAVSLYDVRYAYMLSLVLKLVMDYRRRWEMRCPECNGFLTDF